jgi:hypothetical protein
MMHKLRHPITMFIIGVLVVIGIGVGVLAATMPPSSPTYSLRVLVADVNAMYQTNETGSGIDFRPLAPKPVRLSEAAAAQMVIADCNEGQGTRVIASGLVTGVVNAGSPSSVAWAIFMDPPGKHIAPSAEPVPKPVILNWYAAFMSVQYPQEQVFCTFGRAANLPPLPLLGSAS